MTATEWFQENNCPEDYGVHTEMSKKHYRGRDKCGHQCDNIGNCSECWNSEIVGGQDG